MAVKLHKNTDLTKYNTFGITAKAAYVAEFGSADDLSEILSIPELSKCQWRVVSGGSNILLTGDFDGVALHPTAKNIEVCERCAEHVLVRADAGAEWDDLVAFCVAEGFFGLENLSLIPGYVGASVIQNIGAYGVEVKDSMCSTEVYLTDERRVVAMTNGQCGFGYRDSVFKRELRGKAIVLSVTFKLGLTPHYKLDYGDVKAEVERLGGMSLANARQAIINIRQAKLPDPKVLGNSGSFFKNPVVDADVAEKLAAKYPNIPTYPAGENLRKLAAGWMIEQAGWKGRRIGDAGVHERQALVLVNYGKAGGADIIGLAKMIQADVKAMFGVEIEMEVNLM